MWADEQIMNLQLADVLAQDGGVRAGRGQCENEKQNTHPLNSIVFQTMTTSFVQSGLALSHATLDLSRWESRGRLAG